MYNRNEIKPIMETIGSEEFISLAIPGRGEIYIKPADAEYRFFDYGHGAGVRAEFDSRECPFFEDVVQLMDLEFRLNRDIGVVFISEVSSGSHDTVAAYLYARKLKSRKTKDGSFSDEAKKFISDYGSKVSGAVGLATYGLVNVPTYGTEA